MRVLFLPTLHTLDTVHGDQLDITWGRLLWLFCEFLMYELLIYRPCLTHDLECVCSAAATEDFTPGTLLNVCSHHGVIVQWTDQGHADTA